ncbi:MAG: polysaccharide biosynthesis tyrosine autokinase [Desulfuromonadaceae bacterium]
MAIHNEEIHLRDYLRVIQKRRGTVVTVFLSVLVAVMLFTFSATPLYQGSVKVLIEKVEPNDLTNRYYYRPYDPEFYETQVQLIKSQAVALKVVKLLSLEEKYATYFPQDESPGFGAMLTGWLRGVKQSLQGMFSGGEESAGGLSGREEKSLAERIAESISADISVAPVKESRIIIISYLSPNPELAALIPNTVAKAFIEVTLEMKMESTRQTMEWMTRKAEEERKKLESAEVNMQQNMRENDIVTLEDRLTVVPQRLSEISTQLVRAEAKRKEFEALYAKVRRVADNPDAAESIPTIASDGALQTIRSQILTAEQQIMEMSRKYGEKHPLMIKSRGDLTVLREKRIQEIARIVASIRNEFELSQSTERSLRSQLEKTKSEAQTLNEKYIQYGSLKREADTNRQLYDALMLKIKEQSIVGETQPVNLWIVERAMFPEAPAKPRKGVNLLLGLLVGVFGGIGLAFFIEYLDNTVKNPEELEQTLGVGVLGVVARTSLMLASAYQPPRKILVTSSGPGEGKTATSVNLALAFAQSDKRVLLIDADLRKPRVHKVFDLGNGKGLSTYLAGATEGDILQKGPLATLSIISSGPIPPNPSELLSGDRMAKLLDTLETRYDLIICDSPPLLSVTDPLILSRLFDGAVVVTRSRQTTYEMAGRSLKALTDVNATILGLVLNEFDADRSGYYYHYGYGNYSESASEA